LCTPHQTQSPREKAILDESRAERERREHEAALRPNAKRISELTAIIEQAAGSEKLLCDLYQAFGAHKHAQGARRELADMNDKACAAAKALGKQATRIKGIPADLHPHTALLAQEMANIFHAATRRN